MRIAIMGSGGVGGYLGARLAASGQDVTLLARGAHLAAIREHGLALRSARGDVLIRPANASDDPAAIGPVEVVIFAVKLYDTEAAAAATRPLIAPHTGVLTLQNGVDSTGTLARVLGAASVLVGVAHIASVIVEPGVIRHTGTMARFVLGELNREKSERIGALADVLRAAGVDYQVSANIQRDIWDKMVFLATFAGVTALIRLPIGPIREDAETRAMLSAGLHEPHAVARAKGIDLSDDFVERTLVRCDGLPHEMKSSMPRTWSAAAVSSCPGCPARSCAWARSSASHPDPRLHYRRAQAAYRRRASRISGRALKAKSVMMWKSLT